MSDSRLVYVIDDDDAMRQPRECLLSGSDASGQRVSRVPIQNTDAGKRMRSC